MCNRIIVVALGIVCVPLLVFGNPNPSTSITVIDSPWVLEEDFLNNPTLHARNDQTVILHLESSYGWGRTNRNDKNDLYRDEGKTGDAGRSLAEEETGNQPGKKMRSLPEEAAIRKNSVRFLNEEAQKYSFCIPDNEPYIVRMKLKRSSGRTVMNTHRGGICEPVMLEPGTYDLDIFHDGRNVGAAGKKAFLHRPAARRHLRSASLASPNPGNETLQEQLVYPNFFALSAGSNSIGKMYPHLDTTGSFPKMSLSASSNGMLDEFVWTFYNGAADLPDYTNSRPMVPWLPQAEWNKGFTPLTITPFIKGQFQPAPYLVQFNARNCPTNFNETITYFCAPAYIFNDLGNGKFNVWADIDINNPFPWLEGQSGAPANLVPVMVSDIAGNIPDPNALTWDFTFIGYADSAKMPELQEGEFAIFSQCNFQGTAFVFDDDVEFSQFQAMTQAEITPPSSIRSIKLGPSTYLKMTKNGQNVADIGSEISCASEPIETDSITMYIDVLQFIAATNSCINCNLAGVDFHGQDFSGSGYGDGTTGVNFSGAILTGANLAGANFSDTNLTDADLDTITGANNSSMSGTIFTGATLACTSFKGSDLTGGSRLAPAKFGDNTFMTDQSCHVDLSAATLDFTTFDVKDWRYFNLSSASVSNVPDTLSSEEDPLDLSGAILSYVGWLQGKSLDYINLGCYPGDAGSTTACPAPSGNMVCTTLKGTVLTGSSLKRACLNNASMEGVFLGYSNLDGADFSGALLGASTDEATTLLGGKAGTLEGAFMRNVDMSGANLTGVIASNINFYSSSSSLPTALANGITAPGANFSQAYMAGADFSGSTSNLQSTNWSGAMLINVDFSQADLSINTSGGINSGTNSTFNGAYMQGALFDQANISDVDFTSTYWDVSGNNGKLNFLIPISNLSFTGYWKCTDLPECPAPEVEYPSGISLPSGTDADNTCPNGLPGPCDKVWDQPTVDISHAYFQSATPGFPQVSEVTDDNQCGGANNPADYSWTYTCETTCEENK